MGMATMPYKKKEKEKYTIELCLSIRSKLKPVSQNSTNLLSHSGAYTSRSDESMTTTTRTL